MPTPDFAELLAMIDDRSAALRAAAGDPGPDARVPGCPDWSVRDLVQHLGAVQRFWAAAVASRSADGPPDHADVPGTEPGPDLLAWSADSAEVLLTALRDAGPDRPCWAWWAASGAPLTSGAVARHQVQEAAVHGFDAQEAAGKAEPLPLAVAADGIGEFLQVGMASMGPWPHPQACAELAASDGPAWVVELSGTGARAREAPDGRPDPAAGARLRGTASDLVLGLYGRHTAVPLTIDGDRDLADRLLAWPGND